MVIKPEQIMLNYWNHGETISYSDQMPPMSTLPNVYAMRRALLCSPSICLPKAKAHRQETCVVCENQLFLVIGLRAFEPTLYTELRKTVKDAGR